LRSPTRHRSKGCVVIVVMLGHKAKSAFLGFTLISGAAVLSSCESIKPVPATNLANEKIASLLVLQDEVLASTADGVYRASLRDKKWWRVGDPDVSHVPIQFAVQPKPRGRIFGFVPRTYYPTDFDGHSGRLKAKAPGLYASDDKGLSWSLRNDREDFVTLLQVADKLFATVREKEGAMNNRVMVSENDGADWKDLTDPPSRASSIFPDPDHPGLICLSEEGIRLVIYQADDSNYKWRRLGPLQLRGGLHSDFIGVSSYGVTLGIAYQAFATLANYFKLGFGQQTSLPGLRLMPQHDSFTFSKSATKRIQIQVQFVAEGQKTLFLDSPKTLDCWALSVQNPDGKVVISPFPGEKAVNYDHGDRQAGAKRYRESNDVSKLLIEPGQSFRRLIDLDEMGDFSEIGKYRISVRYNDSWLATTNNWVNTPVSDFMGLFGSQAFDVTITP